MALRVFKADEASRDYENDFFRSFSGSLVEVFKKEKLNGILIGHPRVPSNKYLKPDCVLITPNRLVLIDFKNHGGKIWLPDDSSFENTPWRHDNTIVDGGTSINPFEQLKKQRRWAEELIGEKTYGRFGIACVVCFQQNMTIMNSVPGKYQAWFSVTNKLQCINKIRDIIGVKSQSKSDVDINKVFSYFEAKPYHDYKPTSFDILDATMKADERRIEAEKREYAAKRKIAELERQIKANGYDEIELNTLRIQLAEAREVAKRAEIKSRKALEEFDEKNHALEVASREAEKARAEADKARAEKEKAKIEAIANLRKQKILIEKAKIEAEDNRRNNKVKLIILITIVMLVITGLFVGFFLKQQEQSEQAELERKQKAQIEEDYKNGRRCIPLERVSDFVGSTVCVEYYVGYVNSNSYYIYLDKEKNSEFQAVVPTKAEIISINEAKEKYLNRYIKVNGTIKRYNDSYEIIVIDLDQIELVNK